MPCGELMFPVSAKCRKLFDLSTVVFYQMLLSQLQLGGMEAVIDPLVSTFGMLYVLAIWSFLSGFLFLIASATDPQHERILFLPVLAGSAIPPLISLWALKFVYDFVPFIRRVFSIDMTDLSMFFFVVIFVYGFLRTVTDEFTGELKT